MLPKYHILFGAIFSLILYFLFPISIFQGSLIFLASVFIDVDHYFWYVFKKKDWNLIKTHYFLKNKGRGTRKLMIFHTIEFHILFVILGLIWPIFYYILIGMIFHSLIDIINLIYEKRLKSRKFSLIESLIKNS